MTSSPAKKKPRKWWDDEDAYSEAWFAEFKDILNDVVFAATSEDEGLVFVLKLLQQYYKLDLTHGLDALSMSDAVDFLTNNALGVSSVNKKSDNTSVLGEYLQKQIENYKNNPNKYTLQLSHGPLPDFRESEAKHESSNEPRGDDAVLSKKDLHEGGGFSVQLPFSHYIGPGNELQAGAPESVVDAAARSHDFRYSELIKLGINPYTQWTVADDELLHNIKNEHGFQAQVVRDYFTLKGLFTSTAHFKGELPAVPQYSSSENYPSMASVTATEGATGSGGGGSNAVQAVWREGAIFTDSSVTCTFSRIFVVPYTAEHAYRFFLLLLKNCHSAATGESKVCAVSPVMGYATPWHYIDVNCASLYFSPLEFQRLIENYGSIKPSSMQVTLSEICIKDVTDKPGGGVQVTDSTTGRLCYLVDDEYQFPYVIGQGQDTLAPELPIWTYLLPQYAYLTVGEVNTKGITSATRKQPSEESAFYVLEHANCLLLGTGSSISSSYQFPSVQAESLEGASQHFYEMYNPLYPSRLAVPSALGGQPKVRFVQPTDHAIQPQNFMPGPLVNTITTADGDSSNTGAAKHLQAFLQGSSQNTRISFRPGPRSQPYHYYDEVNQKYVHGIDSISYGMTTYGFTQKPTEGSQAVGRYPNDKEQNKQLQGLNIKTYFNNKGDQKYTEEINRPLMVGSIWNRRAFHYETQLWTKLPNLDEGFKTEFSALGGWALPKPPPMIFLKMNPAPGPEGFASITSSTLAQYATGILTVTLTFALGPRKHTGRWNPQPACTPPHAAGHLPYVLYDPEVTKNSQNHRHGYEKPEECWSAKKRVHLL
ncbi:capsid protein [Rhesus macaque parvovirus]|uniref:Capsid protein n=1 Tax=Rhesus macaque parvovirus TaxID=119756 RepID=Q9J0X6_9VIRU|nr:capsid protein [Rhesus macaque parvovirus]AAF61211.1 capsid protein [Rhesus macaque parvovirus]